MFCNKIQLAKHASTKLAILWLILFSVLVVSAALTLPQIKFETNIIKLLPEDTQNPLIETAQNQQNTLLNESLIWLVGAPTEEEAYTQATKLHTELIESGLFSEVHLHWRSEEASSAYKILLPYRYHFLTENDKALLHSNADAFTNNALHLLYSPMGMQYAATLEQDPIFTLGNYINSLNTIDLQLYQDAVITSDGDWHYILLLAKSGLKNTDTRQHHKIISLYETAKSQYSGENKKLLAAGFPLYSAYGAQSAEHEISTIGSLSTLSVIVLLLFAFRSAKPLLLSMVSISVGVLAAITISNAVFERLHIITLVFGSSLIGCIDYSFHYFCNSFQKNWNSFDGLKNIFTSIGLGMLGSVIAFSSLAFTPFPGLQQMAIFSASGLFFAWLTVVLLFPYLSKNFQCNQAIPLVRFYPWYLQKWPNFFHRYKILLILSAFFVVASGLYTLNLQDDIRSMQKAKPELISQENEIRALLKQKNDAQYFIVSGESAEAVLQKETALIAQLKPLIESKTLKSYSAISELYPNAQNQLDNRALIKHALFDNGKLRSLLLQLNMEVSIIDAIEQSMPNNAKTIRLEEWLSAAPKPIQQQWLGCQAVCASVITLRGISDTRALEQLARKDHIYWVDQVQTINNIMLQYRHIATLFVGMAAFVIMMMMIYPLGLKAAITIISIPITAIFITIGIIGLLGTPFNLFNVFALILVLGFAFDYSIFHYLGDDHRESTSLAVLLSLITTTLSFGLLMLSETMVIQAFGLTLSIGIACAFILSPLLNSTKGVPLEST